MPKQQLQQILRRWRSTFSDERASNVAQATGVAILAAALIGALVLFAPTLGSAVDTQYSCLQGVLSGSGAGCSSGDGTTASQPAPAESDGGGGIWGGILDGVQIGLDVVGIVPGVGEIADGANALISLARGDYAGAALSAAAMIPFAGWGATGAKWVRTGVNYSDELAGATRYADEAAAAGRRAPCTSFATPGGKVPGLAKPMAADCPLGFRSADEFAEFGDDLNDGLRQAGYDDAETVMQGSSVTGRRHSDGRPFDPVESDFDVAVSSEDAFLRALDSDALRRYYKTNPDRIGPIKPNTDEARELGLNDMLVRLSEKYGRDVNIMLYDRVQDIYNRGPSFPIPRSR